MRILTGIDLPFSPSCGSMTLCDDLYGELPKGVQVRFLALNSEEGFSWSKINDIHLLNVDKVTDEFLYDIYVSNLENEIKKHISEYKPDVIHIQHLSYGMALAFSRINLPKIAICHGTGILSAMESDFHKKNIETILLNSDVSIFPTLNMLNDCKKIISNINKYKIIPWGIPDDIYKVHKNKSKPKDKYNLLYAGRLTKNKGVDTIIHSLKYLDDIYKLTIIGKGEILMDLKSLVKKNNLEKRVKFIDFQKRRKLWELFFYFDVIIISTKIIEAFCLTSIEAQAHGLPVITSDIGGTKEVVSDSGLIYKAGDSVDLAKNIKKLFSGNNYEKYSSLSLENSKKYKIAITRKGFLDLSRSIIK